MYILVIICILTCKIQKRYAPLQSYRQLEFSPESKAANWQMEPLVS